MCEETQDLLETFAAEPPVIRRTLKRPRQQATVNLNTSTRAMETIRNTLRQAEEEEKKKKELEEEQKRKEKKKREERNENEDADLLEDEKPEVSTPLTPGLNALFHSRAEQEEEQKEKHYKDSLTAIAVNCEVVSERRSCRDHPGEPHKGRDATPERDLPTKRSGRAGEGCGPAHQTGGDAVADEGVQRHSPRRSFSRCSSRTTRSTWPPSRRRRVSSARTSEKPGNLRSR